MSAVGPRRREALQMSREQPSTGWLSRLPELERELLGRTDRLVVALVETRRPVETGQARFVGGEPRAARRDAVRRRPRRPDGLVHETAVGSVFFSDRLAIPRPGLPDVYLCALCDAQIRASHKPAQMTAEDVASFTRNASAASITWWNHN